MNEQTGTKGPRVSRVKKTFLPLDKTFRISEPRGLLSSPPRLHSCLTYGGSVRPAANSWTTSGLEGGPSHPLWSSKAFPRELVYCLEQEYHRNAPPAQCVSSSFSCRGLTLNVASTGVTCPGFQPGHPGSFFLTDTGSSCSFQAWGWGALSGQCPWEPLGEFRALQGAPAL